MNYTFKIYIKKEILHLAEKEKNISKHLETSIDMYETIGLTTNMWTDNEGGDVNPLTYQHKLKSA